MTVKPRISINFNELSLHNLFFGSFLAAEGGPPQGAPQKEARLVSLVASLFNHCAGHFQARADRSAPLD